MNAPAATAASQRWRLAAAIWALQPLTVALAAPTVPPLLQASMSSTATLFLLWLWTRVRHVPVFARDSALRPGLWLALLAGVRVGLLYVALARAAPLPQLLLACASLLLTQGLIELLRSSARLRPLGVVLLALLALLAGLSPNAPGAAFSLLAGVLWAVEIELLRRPALQRCAAEKLAYYQLIGAVVLLPLLSVAVGESWRVHPDGLAWLALLAQTVGGAMLLPPWLLQRRGPRQLALLFGLTLAVTLALQAWLLAPVAGLQMLACVLLLPATWLWLRAPD